MKRLRIPWPVRLAGGVLLLVILLLHYDASAAARSVGETRWWIAAPAIVGLVAVHALGAATWRLLAVRLAGADLSWGGALRTYYAAQAVGTITPGNIGSDAYRMRTTWTDRRAWREAVAPVAVHRAASYLSLAALAACAALFVPVPGAVRLGLAVTLVVFVVLGGAALARDHGRRRSGSEAGRSVAAASAAAVALSAAFHLAAVGLTGMLVAATTSDAQPGAVVAALMVARMATLLPLTPAGIGVQEGAFALLLPEAGIGADVAIAVSALTRLAMVATLAVGCLALASEGGRGRWAPAGPRATPPQAKDGSGAPTRPQTEA